MFAQTTFNSSHENKKKPKKFKKVNLLKNPFSDSSSTFNHLPLGPESRNGLNQKDPFSDSCALLSSIIPKHSHDYDDDDDDGEEDEERMVQSRRDALAALDPKSKDYRTAEFKSLKVHSPSTQTSITQSTFWKQPSSDMEGNLPEEDHQQASLPQIPPPLPQPHERVHTFDYSTSLLTTTNTPPQSFQGKDTASGPQNDDPLIPEIAIRLATPSPKNQRPQESSPISEKSTSKPYLSTYKNFFQRITSSSVNGGEKDGLSSVEGLEDHIGAEIDRDPAALVPKPSTWSLRRDTFGTPMQQGNRHQRRQESRSQKQRSNRKEPNPWDSGDDMLTKDPDCADDHSVPNRLGQEDQSLKGRVGGGRGSDDTGDSVIERQHSRMPISFLSKGSDENLMIHPRTAAINGTFHRVQDETVPVPSKPARPISMNSSYANMSLASPPSPIQGSSTKNGIILSRGESLDSSSFNRSKRGSQSLIMGFGSVSIQENAREQQDDERVDGMLNGHPTVEDLGIEADGRVSGHRSSSATFGLHVSPSSPQSFFPKFSSFRDLVSSATSLNRSSSAPENASSSLFSPASFVRRSRSTAFGGYQDFHNDISAHKSTPVMVPTIVTPPYERSALSATTVEFSSNSASSSVTMISSSNCLNQQEDYEEERFVNQGDEAAAPQTDVSNKFMPSSTYASRQQVGNLLRVPEPAMTAANRTLYRTGGSPSNDSLLGPLTSNDYIGQFEKERAQARQGDAHRAETMSTAASSSTSLATTINMGGVSYEAFPGKGKIIDMVQIDGENEKRYTKSIGKHQHQDRSSSFWKSPLRIFRKRARRDSKQSDISESLMHLPEPSRLEGICSCRGFINITSMVLILCGLLLLILGYPVIHGLKKDRMEAATVNMANNVSAATNMANATAVVNGNNVTVIEGTTLTHINNNKSNGTTRGVTQVHIPDGKQYATKWRNSNLGMVTSQTPPPSTPSTPPPTPTSTARQRR
ncbi:hypothetical protein BGZ49_000539 [Haplosporangium sp. Z 27]|nr:hypothetical protein BGZ49_000539 [Haplosporangium sp. Z 27]